MKVGEITVFFAVFFGSLFTLVTFSLKLSALGRMADMAIVFWSGFSDSVIFKNAISDFVIFFM